MKKKVVIVDGEVMSEDDPRYAAHLARQRGGPVPTQPASQAATAGPGARGVAPRPQGRGNGFDFSAPPFRLVDNPPGASALSTQVEIFGMRLPAVALAGLALMAMQFGTRALFAGAILLYLWQVNQAASGPQPASQPGAAPGPQQPQQQGRPGGGGGGAFADIINAMGLGNSGTGQPAAGSGTAGQTQLPGPGGQAAGSGQRGGPSPGPPGRGEAFSGAGRKLGS